MVDHDLTGSSSPISGSSVSSNPIDQPDNDGDWANNSSPTSSPPRSSSPIDQTDYDDDDDDDDIKEDGDDSDQGEGGDQSEDGEQGEDDDEEVEDDGDGGNIGGDNHDNEDLVGGDENPFISERYSRGRRASVEEVEDEDADVGRSGFDGLLQDLTRPSEYLRRRCPLCFGGVNWNDPQSV